MSTTQSLADQLGWCITTKDYLNDLDQELGYVAGQYERLVDELKQQHYLTELLTQIEAMQQEFQRQADDLIRHVEAEHLAYIDNQSRIVQGSLGGL
jgi:DNA-binding FrmR family transcriptional regulator